MAKLLFNIRIVLSLSHLADTGLTNVVADSRSWDQMPCRAHLTHAQCLQLHEETLEEQSAVG